MTFAETKAQFLTELRDLLDKYGADISFNVGEGSDTFGLHGEEMVVSIRDEESKRDKKVLSVDAWCLSAKDIKVKKLS